MQLLLLLLLAVVGATARRLFVFPQGMRSPHCPGAAFTCYDSLSRAMEHASAGQTVVLLGHSYKGVRVPSVTPVGTVHMRPYQPAGADRDFDARVYHHARARSVESGGKVQVQLRLPRGVRPPRLDTQGVHVMLVRDTEPAAHAGVVPPPSADLGSRSRQRVQQRIKEAQWYLDPYAPYSHPDPTPRMPGDDRGVVLPIVVGASAIFLLAFVGFLVMSRPLSPRRRAPGRHYTADDRPPEGTAAGSERVPLLHKPGVPTAGVVYRRRRPLQQRQ